MSVTAAILGVVVAVGLGHVLASTLAWLLGALAAIAASCGYARSRRHPAGDYVLAVVATLAVGLVLTLILAFVAAIGLGSALKD
jgi:hypothetical protein